MDPRVIFIVKIEIIGFLSNIAFINLNFKFTKIKKIIKINIVQVESSLNFVYEKCVILYYHFIANEVIHVRSYGIPNHNTVQNGLCSIEVDIQELNNNNKTILIIHSTKIKKIYIMIKKKL